MTKRIFSTFSEASAYAKKSSAEAGVTVRLQREDAVWAVLPVSGPSRETLGEHLNEKDRYVPLFNRKSYFTNSYNWERHFEEQRKLEEKERRRRQLERKAHEAELREKEERRPYLAERSEYYRSLTEDDLDKLWAERGQLEIEKDETLLLRDIVREKKGIPPAPDAVPQACVQCGMVGENCTCGRSWF